MYLRRKIDSYLLDWKLNDNRLPLLIKGCRQVGKTRSIMHFALSNYESVIEINFALEPKYKKITVDGYDVNSIIKNISRIDPTKKFIPGNTLIFFDEITYFRKLLHFNCIIFFCQIVKRKWVKCKLKFKS